MNKWIAWILSAALCAVLMGCAEQTASPGGAAESTPETAAAGTAEVIPCQEEHAAFSMGESSVFLCPLM